MLRYINILLAGSLITLSAKLPMRTYALTPEPIDVVIPCVEKDIDTLDLAIEGIRTHGQNIRRIIVVSRTQLTDKAEWFDEANYPFTQADIAFEMFGNFDEAQKYLSHPKNRIGWLYQQFLKLYAPVVIPGISSNVLILDADIVFMNPVSFIDKRGQGFYAPGTIQQYGDSLIYPPYYEHMHRLLPGLTQVWPAYTGISHHMLFQRPVILDLFQLIETHHKTDTWRAMCRCIDPKKIYVSSMSEYEIYFNFLFSRTKQAHIRLLDWKHDGKYLNLIPFYQQQRLHYVAFHAYSRA